MRSIDVVDLSHHNTLPWGWGQAFMDAGVKGIIHKASQYIGDEKVEGRLAYARTVGLKVGVYHFGVGDRSAKDQVSLLLRSCVLHDDMRVVLDFETNPNGKSMTAGGASEFMQELYQRTGHRAIIYATSGYIRQCVVRPPDPTWTRAWIAQYGPRLTPPDFGWVAELWQFSQDGKIGKIGPLDVNVSLVPDITSGWSTKS